MSSQFRVGQKVVCVDDSKNNLRCCPLDFEGGWYASRFRPIVKRKTSIAIFHEILNTQRVRTPA